MAEDAGMQQVPDGLPQELAALTSRVVQLERMVAELSGAAASRPRAAAGYDPMQRTIPAAAPATPVAGPPPPPMPEAATATGAFKPAVSTPSRAQFKPLPNAHSLENKLGSQIFNMIGIVALLVGASWGLKLAIDNGLLGYPARVIIGLAAGAGLVLWSETFRRKGLKAFSYSLKAVGSGVLYLSLWTAFHHHLLPAEAALIAMILVTAWNGYMAWSQDSELLAAYGLAGGFATPLLLSSGGNHEIFLFTYIGAIDAATVLLMRYKPWRRLLLPAFAATVFFFIGWYSEFFHRNFNRVVDADTFTTAWFVFLFFVLFAALSIKGFRTVETGKGEIVIPILIPLGNALFVSLALSNVMRDSGFEHESLTWLMVALSALYLGLMRMQATAISRAIHLACAVIFLTIAIPLKASGHTLTTAWLVEGLVLYWVATRFEHDGGSEATAPAKVLWGLSLAGYLLGLMSLAWHWLWSAGTVTFFSAYLGAALVAVASLSGAAWLAIKAAQPEDRREPATLIAALFAIDLVALLLALREIAVSEFYEALHPAFNNAEFGTALVGLAILAAVSYTAYRLSKQSAVFASCASVAGVTLILFNLVAILSVEREIGALWTRSAANLQRSLAISGFLMLYGAVLLTAGFLKRSAFVRWQALVLLLFTICKVFLFDISGLSQGYRVVSFLALGGLLMGVSLAYQKDLLGLRNTPAPAPEAPVAEAAGGES